MTSPCTVGLVGLGLLGSALVARWRDAGWEVVGFDVHPDRRAEFSRAGGKLADSAADVAVQSPVLFLSLPNSDIVAEVLGQIGDAVRGKLLIDTSTGAPEAAEQFARQLAPLQATFLDATILGSSQQVRQADVVALVGGDPAAWQLAQVYFPPFCRQAFYLGPAGSGARMKLVANLALGLHRAVLAESLLFATACGVDAGVALEVLRAGMAYSRVMDTKGAKMVERRFEPPEARLAQHHKDVRLMLAAATRQGVHLPLTATHDQLLSQAEELGWGDSDNSAILMALLGVSR